MRIRTGAFPRSSWIRSCEKRENQRISVSCRKEVQRDRAMAASASVIGWTRDSFWPQSSNYADRHHRGNHLLAVPGSGLSGTSAALPSTQQHQQVTTVAGDQEIAEGSNSEGGDYSLRAHELIASPNSLYEVLETLGKPRRNGCMPLAT